MQRLIASSVRGDGIKTSVGWATGSPTLNQGSYIEKVRQRFCTSGMVLCHQAKKKDVVEDFLERKPEEYRG